MPNSKKDFLRLANSSAFSSIALAENKAVPKEVQILKVGTFNHPSYGKFEITTQTLTEMKKNFDDRVRGIDVAFDYFHDSDREASAWPQALELRENGTELWAVKVEWTPKAEKMLSERELRYFSPDFAFQWQDPETGAKYKNVLFGGALTNRPFLKEMQAIVADEGKSKINEPNKGEQMELDQLKAQVADLTKAMGERDATIAQMKADNAKLLSEKEDADKKVKLAEKETKFNLMLTEGKACPAQKAAYIAGDMDEFAKLAQPLNTKGAGSSENNSNESDKTVKILKLAEEKKKADPKLSHANAVSQAKKEIEKSEQK